MSDKAQKAITGNVLSLGLVSFLTDVSSEMIYPLLPIFLTRILGAGPAFIGLIEGVAETTASLLKLVSGALSDRLRKRKILVLCGYTLSTFARPLVATATAGWHVLIIRFTDRVGKGIRTSPRDALIADSTPEGQRGKAFGFQRGMDHAGAAVGPLIATILLATVTSDYRTIFWLSAIPGLLTLFFIIFAVKEFVPVGVVKDRPITLSFKGFDRRFKILLGIIIVFTLGNSTDAFLLLRAKSLGVPDVLIPTIWLVLHVVKATSSMPGGMLSDRIGRRPTLILGWLVYGIIYLGFAGATIALHAWLLFAAYGIYYGLTEGTEKALVADLVPSEQRGTAYGLYNVSIGVGALPASLLLGFLWGRFGPGIAFATGAGLALVAAIALWLLLPQSDLRQ